MDYFPLSFGRLVLFAVCARAIVLFAHFVTGRIAADKVGLFKWAGRCSRAPWQGLGRMGKAADARAACVAVSHSLAAAGLANSLGRMTLYPPWSFAATESHGRGAATLSTARTIKCCRRRGAVAAFYKSSTRLTLLRTVASTCFFVRSRLTLRYSANSQRNARAVDGENVARRNKVTLWPHGRVSLCSS